MTSDDIIRMAHEAEMTTALVLPDLQRFAALVAQQEREACAMVCEQLYSPNDGVVAAAIRARCAK